MTDLCPVAGCVVSRGPRELGKVIESLPDEQRVKVHWFTDRTEEWLPLSKLRCGLQIGMDVQDIPYSRIRRSLGEGHLVELRELGGRTQALVELQSRGERLWLPWENLRFIRGVALRLQVPLAPSPQDPELFRLKNLAYALQMWNENTGALSHLDIDPLPHQIHLVHHILASGNLNWLIADDVGLGKTIEVGMLISALKQRGSYRRILIVTPSGLAPQWQDEMRIRFGFDDFQIYGDDFNVSSARLWKLHDHVIASIDRLKGESHLESVLQADPWDLIIFDEAHRLSRRQYGGKVEASDRYRLAAHLRRRTDSLVLLSATPHQGMPDKFHALLELVRPELKGAIRNLERNPDVLRHMVIRNNKADVTDAEGNFIFRGKVTRAVTVATSEEAKGFDKSLQEYLRKGYALSGNSSGTEERAVGFVMTVYRKLAASSAAAIYRALTRRLRRLRGETLQEERELWQDDARFVGEYEERAVEVRTEFFTGEAEMLESLCVRAEKLLVHDLKLTAFINAISDHILSQNPCEKVLIFTEYRATQQYIAKALSERFGETTVRLIHGSQDRHERLTSIHDFDNDAQFLVSTEAGGEGINLQRRCHIMINFDLPWNPMRLVQRIGRLYRYGQQKPVIVFNLHAPDTLDAKIVELIYERLESVVRDMAPVSDEFKPGLEDEVLGQLAELVDLEGLIEEAVGTSLVRTQDRIDQALQRAREAAEKQRELFRGLNAYDPGKTFGGLVITEQHLESFVRGMFDHLGIKIELVEPGGTILNLVIPENITEALPGTRTRIRASFFRSAASVLGDVHLLDLDSPLVGYMVEIAKSYDFDGLTACSDRLPFGAVITSILRWQNDQGQRMRQELTSMCFRPDGSTEMNPTAFSEWLQAPAPTTQLQALDKELAKELLRRGDSMAQARLGELANRDLHPESNQWIGVSWAPS